MLVEHYDSPKGHFTIVDLRPREMQKIEKQGPPRPGLVPKSGDYEYPDHWVLPD